MKPGPIAAGSAWPPDVALLIDDVCNRYEAELRAGRRPGLEFYLAAVPEPARAAVQAELQALDQAYAASWQLAAKAQQTRVTLTVMAGVHKGRTFTFAGHDTFIVGRSIRAHLRLSSKDKYCSRFHFVVEVNPPRCRLLDMGSTNGTYVNGNRVKSVDLHDGDQIKAGHTILRLSLEHVQAPPLELQKISACGPTMDYPAPLPVGEVVAGVPSGSLPWAEPFSGAGPSAGAVLAGAVPAAAAGICQVCAAAAAPLFFPSVGWPLCDTCRQQIAGAQQVIPGFLLVRQLGQGGMGVVHLALRVVDGKVLALKMMAPAAGGGTATDIDRFLREARILRELHHLHIVPFLDMGAAGGRLFFAMDYVPGTDAKRLLREHGPLPIERALTLTCQVLEALEYAHDQGFVHRDIKPANLLVSQENGRDLAKLADFGLARIYQSSNLSGLTLEGDVGGTLAFMPPEQITNFRDAKPPVDQYAVAATLYNLLTNQYIFDLPKQFEKQILMILEKAPVPIRERQPHIPKQLAAVIHRALAKDPKQRFKHVRALRRELLKFCL